jgi:hypothetical protein
MYTSKCLPALQSHTTKINSNKIDMYSLPILWPFRLKRETLRRWSESLPSDTTGPLTSLSEKALGGLSTKVQICPFGPSNSEHKAEVVDCTVFSNWGYCAHFIVDCSDDKLYAVPNTQLDVKSAIHNIGIPESCTDIMYLLIDDLLHMSEQRVDRFFRIWCSSGAAMLVSSTIIRSFNAAGLLVEVSRHASVE